MTPAAPAVGFVSDDLTGGLLVASYFEEAGLACPVILGAEAAAAEPPRAPLAVVATRARLAPAHCTPPARISSSRPARGR